MPQFRSLPSLHGDDVDVIEESVTPGVPTQPVSQPLRLKAFAAVSTDQLTPVQDRQHIQQDSRTGSLTPSTTPLPFNTYTPLMTRKLSHGTQVLSPTEGEHMTGPTTGPISPQIMQHSPLLSLVPVVNDSAQGQMSLVQPPSLINALQATLTVPRKTEQPFVIPAESKRTQVLPETSTPPRRMRRRMRHALALGITFGVLLLTLLSLAPLDDGQSTYHMFTDSAQGSGSQQNWDISAHTIAQLPGNGGGAAMTGGNTTTNTNTSTGNANLPASLSTNQYVAIAQQDATNAGISPVYFVRQIFAESGFNPNAYSPAGAVGIAQFEPSTAYALGVDPYDPISALQGAAKLMASYNNQYGGDYAKALAAYNAGGGNVQLAVQNCGGNWLSCMPLETQNYVAKIMYQAPL